MKLRCLLFNHEWVYGRVAERHIRDVVKTQRYHNRACSVCGKEDLAADLAEREYNKIMAIKEVLFDSPGDPANCDIKLR